MSIKPFSFMTNSEDFPSFRVKTTYHRGKNNKGLREKEVRMIDLDNHSYYKPYNMICKPYSNLIRKIGERYKDLVPKLASNASFEERSFNFENIMEDIHLLYVDETGDKILITDDDDLSSILLHIRDTAEKNNASEYPVVNFLIEKIANHPEEGDS